jgi:DNA/RNA endonuclease YhcR with UshA esterase domain
MKKYLAVFLGTPGGGDAWNAMPEAERKAKEKEGMMAWMKWAQDHGSALADMGGPLGKTKKVSKKGIEDIRNEMGAFSVVSANSHEEAAKMFENHPHFTIFPGDRVEVMEILPIPTMNN